jgi:adenylate cyclase class 2
MNTPRGKDLTDSVDVRSTVIGGWNVVSSTFEVEVKIPVDAPSQLIARLDALGAKWTNQETQVDTYFQHPVRSFEETDEALRLRKRTSKPSSPTLEDESMSLTSELTYKGPKIDSTTKTRVEYSTGISNPSHALSIFLSLGFTEVATVTKERMFCEIDGVTVSIDDVAGLGVFTELEIVVDGADMVEAARSRILALVEKVELDMSTSIRESYLELLLAHRGYR